MLGFRSTITTDVNIVAFVGGDTTEVLALFNPSGLLGHTTSENGSQTRLCFSTLADASRNTTLQFMGRTDALVTVFELDGEAN